jgi:hypothetical protein
LKKQVKHNDHRLSEILENLVETPKIQSGFYKVSIEEAWSSLMGKTIVSYTDSIQFNKTVLVIKLSSAPLRHELSMGKEKLIKMLNEKVGKRIITDLIIR